MTDEYPSSRLALDLSLQTSGFDWVLAVVILAGFAAITGAYDGRSVVQWVLVTLGFLASCMGISILNRARQMRGERQWIDGAPHGLDPVAYRALLSEHHASRAVALRIEFGDAIAEQARHAIAARFGPRGRWIDDVLVVMSPMMDTVRTRKEIVLHDNAKVHRWVRGILDETLPPVAAGHTIKSLTIVNA